MIKLLVIYLVVLPAYALNLNLFKPAQTQKFSLVEGARSLSDQKNYFFGAFYQYVNKPIVGVSNSDPSKVKSLITGMNIINFSAARIENKYVQWGITGAAIQTRFNSVDQVYSLGDSSIYFKYYFPKAYKGIYFSLMPQIHLPTGKNEYFTSDQETGYEIKFAMEKHIALFDISFNLGYLNSPSSTYLNLDYSSRILASLGVYLPLSDKLGIVGEITTARTLPFNSFQNPGELYSGLRYKIGNLEILSGISVGNLGDNQSNNFSFTGGLRYVPNFHKETKKEFFHRITKVMLRLSDRVVFDQDSSILNNDSKKTLNKISDLIKSGKYIYKRITLKGYTNRDGEKSYNKKLSFLRAKAVKDYFVSRGVSKNSLVAEGFGELESDQKNQLNLSKIKDRKVEFLVE